MTHYLNLEGQILGECELHKLISKTTMSENYLAYQIPLKRDVSVKVLDPILQQDERFVSGFMREAEIVAQLEHPHIIPIYTYGTHEGHSYIVRRLMNGGKLSGRLAAASLPAQDTIRIVKQIGDALEYIHSRNMVNGNVKPDNIVFDSWGSPYLVGFSLAGLNYDSSFVIGTPDYMSPERWTGAAPTAASDQYAFAITAYEMLTRQLPTKATSWSEMPEPNIIPQRQPDIDDIPQPEIPLAAAQIFNRAMAEKPEDRYPTVMDFVREFEKAMADTPKPLFISYSRQDKEYAQQLSEHLQRNGFPVWIDSKIDYGDAWFDEIDDAVKTCAAFVLLMTPHSQQSEWVKKEILLAKRYKKPIFPVLLDGEEFPIVIDIQFADVRSGEMPTVDFHRRLRRAVFGDS